MAKALCNATVLNLSAQFDCLCASKVWVAKVMTACVCACVRLCVRVCVPAFACVPVLASVYISALICQALLGCRQAGSWIMAPALCAGRTHLKEQQVENDMLFFLFLFFSSLSSVFFLLFRLSSVAPVSLPPSLRSASRFGRWQRPRLAGAVEDLAESLSPTHSLSPHSVLL